LVWALADTVAKNRGITAAAKRFMYWSFRYVRDRSNA
jgi:hypothetical protein